MATTSNSYVGNGSQTQYSVTFPYIDTTDIEVYVNSAIVTNYIFVNASTIEFNTAPANGATILIQRVTNIDTVSNVFYPGSAIRARDLNDNFDQTLYIAQETEDRALKTDGSDPMLGDLNLGGFDVYNGGARFNQLVDHANNRITGVGNPSSGSDAATKDYVDAVIPTVIPGFDGAAVARFSYTAIGGETALASGDQGVPIFDFVPGNETVYLNGSRLTRGVDYTCDTTTLVTFTEPLLVGDVVDALSYNYIPSQVDEDSVATASIQDGAVTTNKLADDAVTEAKLAGSAVTEAKLADGAVTEAKVASNAVTTAKIADDAVTEAKLADWFQDGTGAVGRNIHNKLKDIVSVKDFGAVGDGVTDDTAAIQTAINAVKGSNSALIIPAGSYKLTTAGTIDQGTYGNAEYAILIDDTIHIDATEAVFPVDITNANVKHSFAFDGVSGGSFTGGKFIGENLTGTTKNLFRGCAVAVNSCEGVVVSNITCENLKASSHFYNSNNCVIKDSLAYRVNQTIQSGTFFGCYSGSFNVISGCTVFGGCDDGDIYAYGTGFGNKILGCKSFNSLYGDDTYALLDPGNQGLGLDANQDSGTVDGCMAYGSYYGIDAKGGCSQSTLSNNLLVRNKIGLAVRAGEVQQDVAGHTLISNNTVLPMDGNGNTNNVAGYTTIGIQVTKCPAVTIDGNYIGVTEATFFAGVPTTLDFASIVYVNDAGSISDPTQTSDIIISNNRIQHTTKFGPNQQYCTGPLIFAIAYYTGATNNIGRAVNFVIDGNTFSPYGSQNDGRIIEINGISSVVYSSNAHSSLVNADLKDIPFVYTNGVPTMAAVGNTFERQGVAFKHVYPAIADMPSTQFMFGFNASSNILGRGMIQTGAPAVIQVQGDGPCMVTGNTYWRVDNGGNPNEGKLLTYDYTTNHALMLTNNLLNGPQTSTSYYAVNGVNGATGANLVIANNLVTSQ